MAEFGVTPEGFVLKRLADIRSDLVAALNEVTDASTGEKLIVDLANEDDPLVQIVDSFSDGLSVAWEELQYSYNQFDPLKSSGAGLSGVVQLNGIRRKAGTFSEVIVNLTGQPNQLIPAGQQITDNDNTFVWELPQILLDVEGEGIGTAICTTKGPNTASPGTLVKILTPISGWISVTNDLEATPGTSEETDIELRKRQQISTGITGASVVDALFSSLLALSDVTFVRVYENKGLTTDGRGIPGKTVAVVIIGGDDQEISDTIFLKQCIGMATYGTTPTEQVDLQGMQYAIFFSRPLDIQVFINVQVTVVDSALWTTDGPTRIKEAILAYVSGQTLPIGVAPPLDTDGYAPGDDLYSSELYVPVNSVRGTQINYIYVGVTSPGNTPHVVIDWNEISSFDFNDITVDVL